jgi:lipid-A-disaccharide synthase
MRYFFSTGEPSGELSAVLLAQAIAHVDPQATFEGIGAQRMRDGGFTLWRDHSGWAAMGPLAAIPKIPPLLLACIQTARHIARERPALVVLVDFGAFNVRLAKYLRKNLKYAGPIMYLFPPAAWLDNENVARVVSGATVPVVAFERQYAFYKEHKFPAVYFGHPLAAQYPLRDASPPPPRDGGTIAILPGSRRGELKHHLPPLLGAFAQLKKERPHLRAIFGAANPSGERHIARAIAKAGVHDASIVRGVREAVKHADAAFVSSGTAVLEVALLGVPSVALYIIEKILARHARNVYSGKYITLPNLMLGRGVIPELLQDAATPTALAREMDAVLDDPLVQYRSLTELRTHLGPDSALQDCAKFAYALAMAGA